MARRKLFLACVLAVTVTSLASGADEGMWTFNNFPKPLLEQRYFDGNIQQLPNRYLYTDAVARSVSVHAAGILEALHQVYGAESVLRELKLRGSD